MKTLGQVIFFEKKKCKKKKKKVVTEAGVSDAVLTKGQAKTIEKLRKLGGAVWNYHDKKYVNKKGEISLVAQNGKMWFIIYPDGSFKKGKDYKKLGDKNWTLINPTKSSEPKAKKDKIDNNTLKLLARKIEDAVSNYFPDGDPFDDLMKYKYLATGTGKELIDILDMAAKKYLKAKSYHGYLADVWDDYATDNPDFGMRNPWK